MLVFDAETWQIMHKNPSSTCKYTGEIKCTKNNPVSFRLIYMDFEAACVYFTCDLQADISLVIERLGRSAQELS